MIHVEPYNSFGEGKAQSIGSQYALKGVQLQKRNVSRNG